MLNKIKHILQATADAIMPRTCPVCNCVLGADEPFLCRNCLNTLPLTHYEDAQFNRMEQLFAGKVPIERAAALFHYEKDSPYSAIIHDIKYRNMTHMGVWMGKQAVAMMKHSAFFDGIDIVVPVPMHPDKEAQRGYNQAHVIAQGVASATGATLLQAIIAVKPHDTQTRKGAYDRWLNTRDTYAPAPHTHTMLAHKHILIIDDVITTGATIIACAQAISHIPGIKISIFTLTAAKLT